MTAEHQPRTQQGASQPRRDVDDLNFREQTSLVVSDR